VSRRTAHRGLGRTLTLVVMPDESSPAAYLLASAVHLKQAAVRAGRLDVAAKADEVLTLLGYAAGSPIDADDQRQKSDDAGNAILKILDGLGL
jgi:hypothetical protein